jgi:hypothetical protein
MAYFRAIAWLAVACLTAGCSGRSAAPSVSPDPPVPALQSFDARVREYVTLHREIEQKLPKLGREATPEEIDNNQRELGVLLRSARSDARQGEFFTPDVQELLARLFGRVFRGKNGKNLLGSIMDENPGLPEISVNERYPDEVPLSTMPPEILDALPELDEDMEYRFIGRRLVLIDSHAHLIVDFTDELLPE